MGDYFDEDDLINDCMEEVEGPPEDDDIYFMDEQEEQCLDEVERPRTGMAQPQEDDVVMSLPEVPSNSIATARRPLTDVYTFERYVALDSMTDINCFRDLGYYASGHVCLCLLLIHALSSFSPATVEASKWNGERNRN